MNTDIEIKELLTRGVGSFIDPEGIFESNLKNNPRDIVIKFGVDPTRPDIHLGHAVVLRRLRKFQDLGCKVIFLIGDYTTQIGDPTGKSKVRPELSQSEIESNMNTYLAQVGKILKTDNDVFSWIRNSDWFLNVTDVIPSDTTNLEIEGKKIDPNSFIGKAMLFENTRMQKTHLRKNTIHNISLSQILGTLRHITHARLIERDMFQERLNGGNELYMHEMLYPVIQGIDSYLIAQIYGSCDVEVGGTDQTFNMLMGRDVMKMNGQQPQSVLSFEVLVGLDGVHKMSKSLDNYISITDEPWDMYGKVMSIPDTSIAQYFTLCTYTPIEDIKEISDSISGGSVNPKDFKMRLGREIVAMYHGEEASQKAEEDFVIKFSKKEIPDDVEEIEVSNEMTLQVIMKEKEIISSNTEWRRLVEDGAVSNLSTGEKIDDASAHAEEGIYKIGKKRFIKIKNI